MHTRRAEANSALPRSGQPTQVGPAAFQSSTGCVPLLPCSPSSWYTSQRGINSDRPELGWMCTVCTGQAGRQAGSAYLLGLMHCGDCAQCVNYQPGQPWAMLMLSRPRCMPAGSSRCGRNHSSAARLCGRRTRLLLICGWHLQAGRGGVLFAEGHAA